ncbi:MAG: hypothetical protein EBR30_02285, partial [Cytophagia bacterium]|nr:hypothetical protein [Cytophagia bacterium]
VSTDAKADIEKRRQEAYEQNGLTNFAYQAKLQNITLEEELQNRLNNEIRNLEYLKQNNEVYDVVRDTEKRKEFFEEKLKVVRQIDAELAALEQQSTSQVAGADDVTVAVVSDEGEAEIPSNIGPIMTFLGIELPEQETDQQTPFAATGTPETGFDVVDRGNNVVNPEKIPSEQMAVELAESLNTTRADLEFIEKMMGPRLEPGDTQMLAKVHEIFQKSMQLYNKRKGTTFTKLEEYYERPDGKRLLDANLESVLTGKPVNYKQKPEAVAITPVTTQMSLFDTPSSGNVASLTLSSLESLHAKVKEFRQQALQESDKFSKFVETGNVPSAPVTETSILDKLQDITRCFS